MTDPTLPELIEALARPEAYAQETNEVEIIHTHISVVFLAGDSVYKLKKPLDLGFLDYSTRERRRICCEAEVHLNRRLAPDVYLGVLPITREAGRLRVGGEGPALDYVVHMRRLPEDRTLRSIVAAGALEPAVVEELGRRIARFHAEAARSPEIARFGGLDAVSRNCWENFTQVRPSVGQTISEPVFRALEKHTVAALDAAGGLIERRRAQGRPCDTHGDLRLEHVYHLPEEDPPGDYLIVDCIEFNDRFRYADPVLDLAFLRMDLVHAGRRDLADVLCEAYFDAAGDPEGRELLPLFVAYRATVRGKVDGFKLQEPEVPAAQKERSLIRARGYFLLALSELLPPEERPCLVLSCGLPGVGKSRLAEALHGDGFVWIRSDAVRKQLAGIEAEATAGAGFAEGIYSRAASDRTYQACLERAEQALFEGRRVAVDATFSEEGRRRAFLDAARRWRVPGVILQLEVDPATARDRLAGRTAGPSDADWSVHEEMRKRWEGPGPETSRALVQIDASGTPEETLARARAVLAMRGLGRSRG